MSGLRSHPSVTIADGATTSDVVDLDLYLLAGLRVDAEYDGTGVTFQAADEPDGTFLDCYDSSGTQITVTLVANSARQVILEPQTFGGARFLRLVSNTAQDGADAVIELVLIQSG